jgi:hypothetical protein
MRNAYILVEKSEGTNHVTDLCRSRRIILKWILKKQGVVIWRKFTHFRTKTSGRLL